MKVLVVSFNDSDNLAIENVLYELESRGHEITIFAVCDDKSSLRMFEHLKAEIKDISELNESTVRDYDIAFCSNMVMRELQLFDIYCFVYTSYLDDTYVTDGADFLFMSRDLQIDDMDYKCASMTVGIPKNDKMKQSNVAPSNRILFIDSGHIPFGRQGKAEIADTILEICRCFPQYEICIKPRWLREKDVRYTHKNLEHIYDIIEDSCNHTPPDNLKMLTQHYDLQELIDSSITVITLFSAVHLDVISRGKGLLILSEWHNEDKHDMRNETVLQKQESLYKKSGCVIPYKDAIKFLPYGLQASDSYKEMMLPYRGGASQKIADVMEYIFFNFLLVNRFPIRKVYRYETFRSEITEDASLTMDSLKRERIKAVLQQRCHMEKIKLTGAIDFSGYYEYVEREVKEISINKYNVKKLFRSAFDLRNQIITDNYSKLMGDAINQSYLLKALYDEGRENEIMSINIQDVLCRGPYFYYLGMIHRQKKQFREAVFNFALYIEEMMERTYDKYPQEQSWGIRDAYNCIFKFYDGTGIPDMLFAKMYGWLYENNLEYLVAFDNKKRIYSYIPSIAMNIYKHNLELSQKLLYYYVKYESVYKSESIIGRTDELDINEKRIKGSLSYKLGFGITWLPRKVRKVFKAVMHGGIKGAWQDGRDARRRFIEKQHVFQITDTFLRKVLKGYDIYAKVMQEYGSNAELFLSAEATGDAYIYGMMLAAYAGKNYPDREPVYGVFGQSSIVVAQLFKIKNSVPLNKDEFYFLYNLLMFAPEGLIHMVSMHYHVFYRHIGIFTYLEGLHGYNYLTQVMSYLSIDNKSEFTKPAFLYDNKRMDEILKNIACIPGRTIVIAPYAKTVKPIPMYFWIQLAVKLRQAGYCVCTNSVGDTEPPVYGTAAVFIPYDQSVPFVERAGAVIGLRSGFLDVVSSANCLKISLCNDDNYKRGICHISDSFSLSAMYGEPKQYDLLYSAEGVTNLLEEVVNTVIGELKNQANNEREIRYEQ
ncbi:MAG: hypothetical protein NC337_07000 [Roseburia sp.]|nr:hypothetical protein [Roseburia sp.]